MRNSGASSFPAAPGRTPVAGRVGPAVEGAAAPSDRPGRVIGVDVARGLALIGMMAVHVFATFDRHGTPTLATVLAAGRSATTFVLVAGVSLAFLSGGQRVVEGRARTAAAAGIAVRALLIGAIGLLLGYAADAIEVEVILPYYAALFLLAIPLLGRRPRTLALAAAALIAVAPVVTLALVDADGPSFRGSDNATFDTLVDDPSGLIVGLLVTGPYPVLAYLAYLCAGLAIGRLDLSSRRLATWLLGGGLCLALTARIVSAVLLYPLGGLRHLQGIGPSSAAPVTRDALLWDPEQTWSWWYLALPAPHSITPIDMVHTLGSAMAVLGAAFAPIAGAAHRSSPAAAGRCRSDDADPVLRAPAGVGHRSAPARTRHHVLPAGRRCARLRVLLAALAGTGSVRAAGRCRGASSTPSRHGPPGSVGRFRHLRTLGSDPRRPPGEWHDPDRSIRFPSLLT